MADQDETRKRAASSSPEGGRDREKLSREKPPPPAHVSVMKLPDGPDDQPPVKAGEAAAETETVPVTPPTSPVSSHATKNISPSNLLFSESNMELLSTTPKNSINKKYINCDFLYRIIIEQETRLFKVKLEGEHVQANEAREAGIRALKRQLQQQASEIELLRNKPTPSPTQVTFLQHMETEFPTLSDDCAALQASIYTLKADLLSMSTDIETLSSAPVVDPPPVRTVEAAPASSDGDAEPVLLQGTNTNPTGINIAEMSGKLNDLHENSKWAFRRLYLEGEERDQYSRRELLRITGVPYKQGEDTTQLVIRIANRLGVFITPNDISVSHRTGRRMVGNSRPILAKFVRRDIKNLILANRKHAGSIRTDDDGNPVRIYIDEELTTTRAKVCRKLRAEKTEHYTRDGKVFIRVGTTPAGEPDFRMHNQPQDWEDLHWSDEVKRDVGIYPM